jgi:hypothetical protein
LKNRLLLVTGLALVSAIVLAAYPNNPPVANDDSASTRRNKSVTINVLANDTDPDPGTLFFVSISSAPSNGTATVNANMTVKYTPNQGFTGTDSFKYLLEDGAGGSDTATVTVTVN